MQQIKKIDQQLNRLKLKKNLLKIKQDSISKQHRRARTRTLIQLGGLVEKSGLMDLANIKLGEDLQLDYEAYEKAATLFEMLSESFLKFENTNSKEFEHLKEKGLKKMKKVSYEKI